MSSVKRKLEQMDAENKELEKKLANQEECLKHSNLKFKEKSAEYTALARQLEAALEEGRQKVQMPLFRNVLIRLPKSRLFKQTISHLAKPTVIVFNLMTG